MEDLLKLKEALDLDTFAPVAKQLQQKAWLMHWSLFVFFNHENGLNALTDLFLQDRWARRAGGRAGWAGGRAGGVGQAICEGIWAGVRCGAGHGLFGRWWRWWLGLLLEGGRQQQR